MNVDTALEAIPDSVIAAIGGLIWVFVVAMVFLKAWISLLNALWVMAEEVLRDQAGMARRTPPGHLAGLWTKAIGLGLLGFCLIRPWALLLIAPLAALCIYRIPEMPRNMARWVMTGPSPKKKD